MIQPFRQSVALYLLTSMSLLSAHAQPPPKLITDFNKDRAGWQIYDYNGGKAGGGNVFFPATWEKAGGVGDSGYIWADDSRCASTRPKTRIRSWRSSSTGAGSAAKRSTCAGPSCRSTCAATSSI